MSTGQGPIHPDAQVAGLVAGYVYSYRDLLAAIPALASQGNWREIERIAHKLKGSGASFGFEELTALGRDMERAAAVADWTTVQECHARASAYVDRIVITTR